MGTGKDSPQLSLSFTLRVRAGEGAYPPCLVFLLKTLNQAQSRKYSTEGLLSV